MRIHRNSRNRSPSGFSLIELLVVVTIVVVLVSMLMPALDRGKGKAKDISCRNNFGQLGKAMLLFAGDHDGLTPGCGFGARNPAYNKPWMTVPFMGREVFAEGDRIFNGWHRNRPGILASYLGIGDYTSNTYNPTDAKKVYRCPQLKTGRTQRVRSSLYSNGSFDYAMIQSMQGLKVSLLRHESQIRLNYRGMRAIVSAKTPIILEEDPGWWLNFGANMEPQHGNIDMLGSQHGGTGNYLASDFSVVSFDLSVSKDLDAALWQQRQKLPQPFAKEWYMRKTPNGPWHNMSGGWFGRYNDLTM